MGEDRDRLTLPRLRQLRRNAGSSLVSVSPPGGSTDGACTGSAGARRTAAVKAAVAAWPPRKSLSFRLSLAINLTAGVVLLGFWTVDYVREQRIHLAEQADRLREEARVLIAAERQFAETGAFEAYVDAYCRQMDEQISPGHHIALADPNGHVLARAHARADTDLESKMVLARNRQPEVFRHAGQDYMAVGVPVSEDRTLLVAQSLTPVKRVIHRQVVSRAVSATVLLGTVVAVMNVLLVRWVRRPIHDLVEGVEAVREGRFDHRVSESAAAELQFLGEGFNRMSAALGSAEKRRRQEMEKARRIHLGLLPSPRTIVPGLDWGARYIPADSIGGDYYDLVEYPDGRWLLFIADISGHGVSAALATAMIRALVRQAVRQNCTLPEMLGSLNREFHMLSAGEHFVTSLAIRYTPSSGELEYVNCGHEAGVVLTPSGECRAKLESSGLPLGIEQGACWEVGHACLHSGESMCLVTDGVPEVPNSLGRLLGRERTLCLIQATASPDPRRHVDALVKQVRAISGNGSLSDDLTVVILRRRDSAG